LSYFVCCGREPSKQKEEPLGSLATENQLNYFGKETSSAGQERRYHSAPQEKKEKPTQQFLKGEYIPTSLTSG